ncbi:dihydrofolate reductase family protein [Streptomyces yerevanensis]|uniref:dihydrofolate reductase family protein n=1 Tax=Streptomyces yerevanensis TaxID=66378 RepID=UPI000526480A|nr:dihydrofolate reductase family protein [Streptomyces yerevanensis]
MRKITLSLSVSLDGYFAGPNGELDWHLVDDEVHRYFNERIKPMGGFLHGRVMHQLMVDYWPTADKDPSAAEPVREFAAIYRDMPKIVYSRTLEPGPADWNTTVVREVVPEEVRALKEQPGGDLGVGGAGIAAEFRRLDLIDEYLLYVVPVILGRGRPLFPEADVTTQLRLAETHTFGNGLVLLRYERVGAS